MMKPYTAIAAGAVGAATLNLAHETARQVIPNAPHVDLLAMRALGLYVLQPTGWHLSMKNLRRTTLIGDLLSNALYYAAAIGAFKNQTPKSIWKRAWLFGLGAGATVVIFPSFMKLGQQKTRNFPVTAALTVAWYTLGSLAAAGAYSLFQKPPFVSRVTIAKERGLEMA